ARGRQRRRRRLLEAGAPGRDRLRPGSAGGRVRKGRRRLMNRLEGKSAIVTGVGSGLGRAIARAFAAEGASVLGCDVDDGAGEETMDGVGLYAHADVSRAAEVARLVAQALGPWG